MKLTENFFGDMAIRDLSPKDANSGGRIIKNLRICGSGLYEYHVSEAPLMGLVIPCDYKDDYFKIFRSPEVLEANKDLYARVPIITGRHVRVNTANAKQLAVGMVGDTVQSEVGDDGETYLYTTGTIIAGDGIEAYEKYGELSVGYDPIVEWAPGTYKGKAYQAVLKGFNEVNHLLICKTARGGHQCMIMDSIDQLVDNNKSSLQDFVGRNGGKQVGVFAKIFKGKQMTGDSAVISALLQSIAVGADPETQITKVRAMLGDTKDAEFAGYLDELAGAKGEDPKLIAQAAAIVDDYYRKHIAGDEATSGDKDKEVIVKKDGDKKNVEVKEDGKETKDIEVDKDGDKKDVKVEEKTNGDATITKDDIAKMIGDAVAAEFAKMNAPASDTTNEPALRELNQAMGGDSTTELTSDAIIKSMF